MLSSLQSYFERWLAKAAQRTIERERPLVIAITGSVGKSSTRQAIAAILGSTDMASGLRVSAKNYNNELGLPLTIFDLSAPGRSLLAWAHLLGRAFFTAHGWRKTGARTLVLEMGADKAGDIGYLTSIARPDIGIVTGITPEDASLPPVHLANYPSLEALTQEKGTLVRETRPTGTVILNADDPRVFALRHQTTAHVFSYGETDASDIRLLGIQVKIEDRAWGKEPVGLVVKGQLYQRQQEYFIPGVFGRGFAYAWAAALAVGEALDLSSEAVKEAASLLRSLPGRTRIIAGRNNVTLFDDSYNAAPASMLAGLRDLAMTELASSQRRIAVVGEMREIGSESHHVHRRIGAEAAKLKLDILIPCGTFAPVMREGALANGMSDERIFACKDTIDAIGVLEEQVRSGDVVFAKSSQGKIDSLGVRMERVVKAFMAEPERAGELLCRQEETWKRK